MAAKNHKLIRRILREGHTLGNHTYNHKNARRLSFEQLKEELDKTQNAVNEAIKGDEELEKKYPNGYPMRQFRPPGGNYDDEAIKNARDAGYDKFIMWSVNSLDWTNPGDEQIKENVMNNVPGKGGVILFHDFQPYSKTCLEDIIKLLIDNGYKFMTVNYY